MDTNNFAPEEGSPLSSSSGSPFSDSSSNHNTVIDNSVKKHTLEVEKTTYNSNSDEGFMSVEEEFETPIVAYPNEGVRGKVVELEDGGSPVVGFKTPKTGEPVFKEWTNDDDDDDDDDEKDDVGGSEVVLVKQGELVQGEVKGQGLERNEGEAFVESNGVGGTEEKKILDEMGDGVKTNLNEVAPEKFVVEQGLFKDGEVVEEKKIEAYSSELSVGSKDILGGEDETVESVTLDPDNSKLDEVDSVKFTSGGDSVVEGVNTDFFPLGGAVVGDVEGSEDSEIGKVEVLVDVPVSLDSGFDKMSNDVKQHVSLNGGETDVSGAEKDENSDLGDTVDDPVVKGNHDIAEREANVDENGTLSVINGVGKIETAVEIDANKEPKWIEPTMEVSTDGFDVVPDDKKLEDASELPQSAEPNTVTNLDVNAEAENGERHYPNDGENEGSLTDEETEDVIFENSQAAKQFLEELERGSGAGSYPGQSSHDNSQRIDGQIVTDSDEEVDTDEEGEGKELFDSAALSALLKAAASTGSEGGSITVTSQDGSRLFTVERPAGLGSSLRSVKPAPRANRPNLFTPPSHTAGGESDNSLSEEEKKKLEKVQQIRVKFLRLVHRLGQSPEESIVAQVLYRLALLAGRQTNQMFSLDAAKRTALQLEGEGKDDLDFSLNILVLGKTGVGKSSTINSIFGEEKSPIHAFEPATNSVKEITGVVDGVKIRVIDCPGLKSSGSEQGANRKVLTSVKKFMKKCPLDIVLYVDRLDAQTRDLNDLPLLRTISSTLGSSIWRSAIVTLTHAASAPPDGPTGSPLSYEVFVAQRSHVVQQSIGQAVGDLRLMNPSLMNPVSLVENHPSCRKNREGQKVLPNGQSWRPQLLLLCYSLKILSEASTLSKPQDPFDHRKIFGFRTRSPPLPYLLSWLLQSRAHPKLSPDQGGDNVDSDVELADLSDSDQEEEEDEYDQLPPFKPLRKTQLAKLSREQKKAYFEEYDYRVKLLQKKQWREELRRMREIKKKGKVAADEYGYMGEDGDPENGSPAPVPVPLPDMVLPPSFDGDNPAYRYRFLEPTSQFLARPVLDTHGWDHDCGYDGVNVEHSLAFANRFPAAFTVQMTKDKKEFNLHLDSSISAKHGESGSTMAGFDIQNVGKQLAYILRGETKFRSFKKNKTAAGISVTFLGENVATGVKLEDQIALGKRLVLVGSTGTVRSHSDAAYGANLEVRLREADFPIGQDQSSLGLSLVKWRGDLALGANLQSQFSIGRSSKIGVRAGLNNKMSGQISVRTSSSEQLQIALVALLPIAMSIYKSIRPGVNDSYSMY